MIKTKEKQKKKKMTENKKLQLEEEIKKESNKILSSKNSKLSNENADGDIAKNFNEGQEYEFMNYEKQTCCQRIINIYKFLRKSVPKSHLVDDDE